MGMTRTPDEVKKGLEYSFKSCWTALELGDPLGYPQAVISAYEAMGNALDFIQQLESRVPRWISVKERLPEYEGWVLVIGLLLKKKKGNYGWCVPHVAEYRHGRWCDSDGMMPDLEDRSLKITHWMPLPEMPKEDCP